LGDTIRYSSGLALQPWSTDGRQRINGWRHRLFVEGQGVDTVRRILAGRINGGSLHYVVLDTAPSAGGLQENALYAADLLVIPSAVDHLSLEGVAEILNTLNALPRPAPPAIRILPTFFDQRTRESKANLKRLRDTFSQILLPHVHHATILRECPALGQTIFEHAPDTRAAAEYAALVWEVINARA
jgi:chromosome partitioning protein